MAQLNATEQSANPPEATDLHLAAARFEANRRFDRRPALENLDRPHLVLSTRTENNPVVARRPGATLAGVGLLLMGLGVGALTGWQLRAQERDESGAAPAPSIGPSRPSSTTVPEAQPTAATVPPVLAPTSTAPTANSDPALFRSELAGLELRDLTFVPGQIDLTEGGIETTERLIDLLLDYPGQPVEVRIRTFSESTPGQNHGLSVHQSNVLLKMLTDAGVESDRVSVVGIGSDDARQTAAAAAIFFDSLSPRVRDQLQLHGPLTLDQPFTGAFDAGSRDQLNTVAGLVGKSSVVLVGYTWAADSDHVNHDRSHDLLDQATIRLVAAGVPRSNITSVGLGSASVEISQRSTAVTATAGENAAIAVAFQSIAADAVSFAPGAGDLTPGGAAALKSVAQTLEEYPDVGVEVAVHYYRMSTSQANHDLSRVQAQAIDARLRSLGVSADRLKVVAHGDPPHFAVPGRDSAVTFTVVR